MTNGIQIGDRYHPKQTEINSRCGVSASESKTTVCLVKDGKVSVHIDKVKDFYTLEVVMTLETFGLNFQLTSSGNADTAKTYGIVNHFGKVYPDYVLKLKGI